MAKEMDMSQPQLTPVERVVLRLHGEGETLPEIGRRIGKRPGTVRRILEMPGFRDGSSRPRTRTGRLLPIERVVLRLRAEGESYGMIGNRVARSGNQVKSIERNARFKMAE